MSKKLTHVNNIVDIQKYAYCRLKYKVLEILFLTRNIEAKTAVTSAKYMCLKQTGPVAAKEQ